MNEKRTARFRRNEALEELLNELNDAMHYAENLLLPKFLNTEEMKYPLILVMGPLRSGTTLFIRI